MNFLLHILISNYKILIPVMISSVFIPFGHQIIIQLKIVLNNKKQKILYKNTKTNMKKYFNNYKVDQNIYLVSAKQRGSLFTTRFKLQKFSNKIKWFSNTYPEQQKLISYDVLIIENIEVSELSNFLPKISNELDNFILKKGKPIIILKINSTKKDIWDFHKNNNNFFYDYGITHHNIIHFKKLENFNDLEHKLKLDFPKSVEIIKFINNKSLHKKIIQKFDNYKYVISNEQSEDDWFDKSIASEIKNIFKHSEDKTKLCWKSNFTNYFYKLYYNKDSEQYTIIYKDQNKVVQTFIDKDELKIVKFIFELEKEKNQ